MIDLRNIEGFYFIGIGGIGMSALALYFKEGGYTIAGYDRSSGSITENLGASGCDITFRDDKSEIPVLFRDTGNRERVIVVYTPAIPSESRILGYFRDNGYRLFKRAEILGEISSGTDTIGIAGTHGKTTVSTMTAHLLKQSSVDCSAFLGGISKNYGSNLITGGGNYTVMEADEFDRSFLRLNPMMAVVTSVDADHLDIYGDHETMIAAYNEFCGKIRHGGTLIVNHRIKNKITCPAGVTCYTYGNTEDADFRYYSIRHHSGHYTFSIKTPDTVFRDIYFPFPGIINIENMTAAAAIAVLCGVDGEEMRKGIALFNGVRRRFDIRVDLPGISYVDDYAHHPEEIRAFIMSMREYYEGRKITGIFQPHLYTRTRDHADSFAEVLDELDEAILLPLYPAREKALPGVSTEMIFEKMKLRNKRMLKMEELPEKLEIESIDVLATIGAGDIDKLTGPIEEMIKREKTR